MGKKKIVSMILSAVLLVSGITIALSAANAQAASIKYVAGNVDKHMPGKKMKVKASAKKITVSGNYGIGGSKTKAFNSISKRSKKTYKVANNCKVQTGDEEIEITSYKSFIKSDTLFGPTIFLKIKNNKVIKVICAS